MCITYSCEENSAEGPIAIDLGVTTIAIEQDEKVWIQCSDARLFPPQRVLHCAPHVGLGWHGGDVVFGTSEKQDMWFWCCRES